MTSAFNIIQKIFTATGVTCCIVVWLCLNACRKEVGPDDFESTGSNMQTIFSVDSLSGITPFAQFNRPGGGHLLFYQPAEVTEAFQSLNGLVAVATDPDWNIIRSSYLGGSGLTVMFGCQMDDNGNVYVCGSTTSTEIRTDQWGAAKNAAYLAKVDKDANILWQTAYSDSTTPYKGKRNEKFFSVQLIDNKPICIGPQRNYDSSWAPMLVRYDENGTVLSHRLLPSLYTGLYPDFSFIIATIYFDLIKLPDNDLIVRNTFFVYQPKGGYPDTGSYLLRYTPSSDQIVWQKYYRRISPQGDLSYCGLLGNGNVAFFDTYFNTLNVMDVTNGNPVNTVTLRNNSYDVNSDFYYNPVPYNKSTIDGDLYFTGGVAKGSQLIGRNPFVIKLNPDGSIAYEKKFSIPQAGFYGVSKNAKGNLQFLGGIQIFNTKRQKLFTTCTDKFGNPVNN